MMKQKIRSLKIDEMRPVEALRFLEDLQREIVMRVAGIMSGTSLDGIDVAVVDIKGKAVTTVAHGTMPYSDETRRRILAVSNTQCHTAEISRLNFELGELYAKAVRTICRYNKLPLETIELIGCHGQTIYPRRPPTPCRSAKLP